MLVSTPGLVSREISTMPCPFFLSALTGSNLSLTTQSPSSYSRRNLIFRMNSPSGRAARSLAALPSVIRAFKTIRPARASIPSAISMSPMSSGSSSSTLHVEKTAAAPSTSNSSFGVFQDLKPWFAGRKPNRMRDLGVQVDK